MVTSSPHVDEVLSFIRNYELKYRVNLMNPPFKLLLRRPFATVPARSKTLPAFLSQMENVYTFIIVAHSKLILFEKTKVQNDCCP